MSIFGAASVAQALGLQAPPDASVGAQGQQQQQQHQENQQYAAVDPSVPIYTEEQLYQQEIFNAHLEQERKKKEKEEMLKREKDEETYARAQRLQQAEKMYAAQMQQHMQQQMQQQFYGMTTINAGDPSAAAAAASSSYGQEASSLSYGGQPGNPLGPAPMAYNLMGGKKGGGLGAMLSGGAKGSLSGIASLPGNRAGIGSNLKGKGGAQKGSPGVPPLFPQSQQGASLPSTSFPSASGNSTADKVNYSTGVPESELSAAKQLNEVYDDAVSLSRTMDQDRMEIQNALQAIQDAKTAQSRFTPVKGKKGQGRGSFTQQQQQAQQLRASHEAVQQAVRDMAQVMAKTIEARDVSKSQGVKILKALRALKTSAVQRRAIAMTRQSLDILDRSEDHVKQAQAQVNSLSQMSNVEMNAAANTMFAVQRAHAESSRAMRDVGNAAKTGAECAPKQISMMTAMDEKMEPLPGPVREPLPIDKHRKAIMEAVKHQPVTCIQGETGCGKSSRVPQYVYYDIGVPENKTIIVTQPRRLACITLAKRVAQEMGEQIGGTVGYRISGDSRDGPNTKLLFVTTGYLLQTLVNNPLRVNKFSHIMLDEVHERSVEADLLTLVLKLVMTHKLASFSLILMSATLQGGLFSEYFNLRADDPIPDPIFVGVKRFNCDVLYLEDLFQLRRKFDRPDLAICVLDILRARTGAIMSIESSDILQQGLERFQKALEMAAKKNQSSAFHNAAMPLVYDDSADNEFWRINQGGGELPNDATMSGEKKLWVKPQIQEGFFLVAFDLIRALGSPGESILVFLPGIGEITDLYEILTPLEDPTNGVARGDNPEDRRLFRIFALHSTIPMEEQQEAFAAIPENTVNVYLASTVAESSITLPKVRVVIDFGLKRHLGYDKTRQVASLMTGWCSHAASSQRSGRTGRVFEGLAIRMIPKLFYQQAMGQYDAPEIENAPLEKLYLNVKQLSHKLREKMPRVGALPPRQMLQYTVQPPPNDRLEDAIKNLADLGALTSVDDTASITLLGHLATFLPLELRLCRLILFGTFFNCIVDTVVMACCLAAQDPFTLPSTMVIKDETAFLRSMQRSYETRMKFDDGNFSEPIMLRNLFLAWMKGLNPQSIEEKQEAMALPKRSGRGMQASNAQRYDFVHHSKLFGRKHAVIPKRMTLLALTVMDVAQRVSEWVPSCTHIHKQLLRLQKRLGVQADVEMRPINELFTNDMNLVRLTLMAACMPQVGVGKVKDRGERSVMAQSMLNLPLKNPFRASFVIQNVSEALLARKDLILKSFHPIEPVRDAVADEKNLYFYYNDEESSESEEEDIAFVPVPDDDDESSSSSEEEPSIEVPERERSESRVRQREGSDEDDDLPIRRRSSGSSGSDTRSAGSASPRSAVEKERRKKKEKDKDKDKEGDKKDEKSSSPRRSGENARERRMRKRREREDKTPDKGKEKEKDKRKRSDDEERLDEERKKRTKKETATRQKDDKSVGEEETEEDAERRVVALLKEAEKEGENEGHAAKKRSRSPETVADRERDRREKSRSRSVSRKRRREERRKRRKSDAEKKDEENDEKKDEERDRSRAMPSEKGRGK